MKSRNKKLIYVSHPYMNDEDVRPKVDKIIRGLSKKCSDCVFVNPAYTLNVTGCNSRDFLDVLTDHFALLDKCDEMWVLKDDLNFYDICVAEIAYCMGQGKKFLLPNDEFPYIKSHSDLAPEIKGHYINIKLRNVVQAILKSEDDIVEKGD